MQKQLCEGFPGQAELAATDAKIPTGIRQKKGAKLADPGQDETPDPEIVRLQQIKLDFDTARRTSEAVHSRLAKGIKAGRQNRSTPSQ